MKTFNFIKTSCEFYILIIVVTSFIWNFIRIFQFTPSYIHQFESFDEFAEAALKCSSSREENSFLELLNNNSNSTNNNIKSNNNNIDNDSLQSDLPTCPIDEDRLKHYHDYELETWFNYGHIRLGGHFKPLGCKPIQKVAIIIPYRNRADQLERFSLYIHQFLPDQLLEYSLYVIEQTESKPFNRAKLFNVGVAEITKIDKSVCCYIFHDVDLLPMNQKNLYLCTTSPRHMSPNLSTLRFHLLYPQLFGGVVAISRESFQDVNGFSNQFYGWGGEDDDMFNRFIAAGYRIERTPIQFGDYHAMIHTKAQPNQTRFKLLKEANKNEAISYQLVDIVREKLYTKILVKL